MERSKERWRSVWDWVLATANRDPRLSAALELWRQRVRAALRADQQVPRDQVAEAVFPFAVASALDDIRAARMPQDRRVRLAAGLLRDANRHLSRGDKTLCFAVIAAGPAGGGGLPPSPPQRQIKPPAR